MLRAKFVRYFYENNLIEEKCLWEVWDDDKLLMKYTVKDIRAGNPITNYKLIATKEFGLAVIDRFKRNKAFI